LLTTSKHWMYGRDKASPCSECPPSTAAAGTAGRVRLCPRCGADLAPRAFSCLHQWLRTSRSTDPQVICRSPFALAITLCAVLGAFGPAGRSSSRLHASGVLFGAVAVLNLFAPYALSLFGVVRRELTKLVADRKPEVVLNTDFSFGDTKVQLKFVGKLAWLRALKDLGGAVVYFLCSAGRMWNAATTGGSEHLELLHYLPLSALYLLRVATIRRGREADGVLSFVHLLLSCAAVLPRCFSKLESAEFARTAGGLDGGLRLLVNPSMFMATTCLSLPTVGSMCWEAACIVLSVVIYLPSAAFFLLEHHRSTGHMLGFAAGPDVAPTMALVLSALPLVLAVAFNLCHVVLLQRYSVQYYLMSKTSVKKC